MKLTLSFIGLSLVLASLFVPQTQAARILGLFPSPSKSHLLIHCAVADTLAEAGHDVTVISTVPNLYKRAKYNFIHVQGAMYDDKFANKMVNKPAPAYVKFYNVMSSVMTMANTTINHPTIQDFLQQHKAGDFDLVILGYFMNDFFLGIGAHFQCPVIVSFMVQPIFPINNMIANPLEASYVPTIFSGVRQPMDFWSRVKNMLSVAIEEVVLMNVLRSNMNKMYRYNFPADRYPPLEEVYKNVSLVLTNHHFSQGPIRPNVPALIEIGGIQIKEKPDPLPQDLAEIIESSDKGVIFFSLGTNVQGSNLSKDKAKMIFNVLSKLPYTVLLKWGDSDFPGQSKNMIYRSWLPQDDILAHPKVKLFITHGGMGSVVESQYHGVPMVGIPFFGDQHSNIANVVKSGFGLGLEYARFSEEAFRNAVVEVLENPSYTQNVQKFSELYRDRPMTPRQLVRYWVDYVIRHNGAKHMQSPAINMPWWQLYSVDVIAFLLSIVFGVVAVLVGLCKLLCCRGKGAGKAAGKKVSKSKKQK
ncbi:UDP-glycosyltransferase UGT5-like isoform X1 [Lucilia sericata]|uniref:UDP-glycosyltransferase UGT5-like isoform X1 n=1 Tax=Lucilia sericata TaxID=13632 RepID=UPI0018A84B47|nr:UDP-glycosyltransferase UGT5-like isoform X1 [Lucilia sericata]